MTEEEARLALLQTKLTGLQNAIQNLDKIVFQIKGWCVTTSLAIGGFAVAYHKSSLLLVGFGAIVGFYLLNCQVSMVQRAFIRQNKELDYKLKDVGLRQILKGVLDSEIVGTVVTSFQDKGLRYSRRVRYHLPYFGREMIAPGTFTLYLFILACLTAEAIILF